MTGRVTEVLLRGILTSQGEPTVEAQLTLDGGATGLASSPVAIAPGRRERDRGAVPRLGRLAEPLAGALTGFAPGDQCSFDDAVLELARRHGSGAKVTLALSLAYAKASATASSRPLHRYFADLAGSEPAMPALLVNVFSGGIHRSGPPDGFQQIMAVVGAGTAEQNAGTALRVFDEVCRRFTGDQRFSGYSASSGLLVTGLTTEDLLTELRSALDVVDAGLPIGVDVAAEHLRTEDGRYRFGGALHEGAALRECWADYAAAFGIGYLEDPFDPADEALWRDLTGRLGGQTDVVGDDLFATDHRRLDPALAGAAVLKTSQIGTVSGTVATARRARELGIACCVSHRSGETEDTAMCDLAVGLGARYIKVGGPRRGDRTAKYNQLLRLAEQIGTPPLPPEDPAVSLPTRRVPCG